MIRFGDLLGVSEREMLKFPNFGRKSLLCVQELMKDIGATWDRDTDTYILESSEKEEVDA